MKNFRLGLLKVCIFVAAVSVKINTSIANSFHKNSEYCQPWRLFEKKHYNNAQILFKHCILNPINNNELERSDPVYYVALCSAKLGREYGEYQLLDFASDYPDNRRSDMAHYVLGNLFLQNQDFKKAIDYYKKIDITTLDPSDANLLNYNLAYSYLSIKDFKSSLPLFIELANGESLHKVDANYYAGFIELKNENFKESICFLQKTENSDTYKVVVPYLIAQSFYRQKKFEDLISYVHKIENEKNAFKNKADIDLLTAEAYFFINKYDQAIPLYEEYLIQNNDVIDSSAMYRLAYSLYMLDKTDEAMKYFSRITFENSPIGQLACYYTGVIYLKKQEFDKALSAFDVASRQKFDITISEQAALDFAKINFSIKNYDAAIHEFINFKDTYPKSKYINEVDQLLSLAYMSTNNYDLAMAHIEKLEFKSSNILRAYQRITFLKANQLFNNGEYDSAMSLANRSLQYMGDDKIFQETKLLKGDIYAMQSQYKEAMKQYEQVFQSKQHDAAIMQRAIYGLGYVYFNTQDYKHAFEFFSKLENANDLPEGYKNDVNLRLADSCYALKKYKRALSLYNESLVYKKAHSLYYQGMIYNLLGEIEKAHDCFENLLISCIDSIFYEKALFENAWTYLVENKYRDAIDKFSLFIEKRPNSNLMPRALLYRAIALDTIKKYDEAIKDYVSVLDKYKDDPCAENALLGIQQSLISEGRSQDFAKYIEEYKNIDQNTEAIEKAIFMGCRSLFYEQQYDAAIVQMNIFLKKYPESSFISEIYYLLGESYFILNNYSEGIKYYEYILSDEQDRFFTKALCRLSSIYYSLKQFDKAYMYYEKLKNNAKTEKEKNLALEGSVKAAFELKKYNEAKENASLYKDQPNLPIKSSNEVNLILAKVAIEQSDLNTAISLLDIVDKTNLGAQSAEAKYLIASVFYKEKKYKESLNVLFELNKSWSQYTEWKNKSFLLIADNYMAMNELFQARVTLQSIVDKCNDKLLVLEAKKRLQKIENILSDKSAKKIDKSKSLDEFKVV